MNHKIRIGTRGSELALWQANYVSQAINNLGIATEVVVISTIGDEVSTIPLYEFGVTGIFTKALDVALLEGTIDIAVHSMKDVPTRLPKGIGAFAVMERGMVWDTLVYKGGINPLKVNENRVIATSSLRRQAQWLHRFPNDTITGIRGNVNTRLQKLQDHAWHGAIFAEVGLTRIHKLPAQSTTLDWMVPAAAQGALLIAGLTENTEIYHAIRSLNHRPTDLAVTLEREFMHGLNAGCSAPVGAYAYGDENALHFTGVVTALDGSQQVTLKKTVRTTQIEAQGIELAKEIQSMGAQTILDTIAQNKSNS